MSGLETNRKKRKLGSGVFPKGPRGGGVDLFVPLPKRTATTNIDGGGALPQKLMLDRILSRFRDTGFQQIALAHIIYGRPRDPDDRVAVALPYTTESTGGNLVILRRLHVVVENLSDVALFAATAQSPTQQLLKEYDLISMSPRNELAFQSACSCPGVDIITLEGASVGNSLPFKLRATDVRAVVNRQAVFEIPYSSAVLNRAARKGLVLTCRELLQAVTGAKISHHYVLLSSGNRCTLIDHTTTDVGPMALRTAGDLANLLQAVLGFDSRTASNAVGVVSGQVALDHAARRRFGDQSISVTSVTVEADVIKIEKGKKDRPTHVVPKESMVVVAETSKTETADDDWNVEVKKADDGFISF